jgi:hypothetical protein
MHGDMEKLREVQVRLRMKWAIAGVLLAAAVAIVAVRRATPVVEEVARDAKPQAAVKPSSAVVMEVGPGGIEDDGHTQWISPTEGPPLDLAGLPSGVQVILALRPRAILSHPEGEKLVAALGPIGSQSLEQITAAVGRPPEDIDQLLIGWQVDRDGAWQATILDAKSKEPAPPLTRDVERLLAHTDSSRHVTLLLRPNFLFGDGSSVFSGSMAALRGPLFWFFGDGLNAAAVSLHWDDNFFVEFLGVPTLDVPPNQMADELLGRVEELPRRVKEGVRGLDPALYGRQVVLRFPEMLRKLAAYTRASYDRDVVELRAYLPAVAGHNLIMGAELVLAEAFRGAVPDSRPAEAGSPVAEQLRRRTSLKFSRDTLETALRMLGDDVGVTIVIRGPDLQLDGITKNQSFGIDVADRPAEEILVEILRLANPDKLATGPADRRQKLVYVVGDESPGGPEVVFVTTRTRAAERGETLPAAFVPTQ